MDTHTLQRIAFRNKYFLNQESVHHLSSSFDHGGRNSSKLTNIVSAHFIYHMVRAVWQHAPQGVGACRCPVRCPVMCKYSDELLIHQTQTELNAQSMNFTIRTFPNLAEKGGPALSLRPDITYNVTKLWQSFCRPTIPVLLFLGPYIF